MDSSQKKYQRRRATFREKDPASSALAHLPTEVEKGPWPHDAFFSVVDEKKKRFYP